MPEIFDKTIQYLNSLDSQKEIITNIYQSPHWKEKSAFYSNKICLPLLMFFDDYENNNALGSHKGISKCGAVYLSIPCLPPDFQSKIENIFLFILFNTLDRSVFKNKIVFDKVIEELKFLKEEGITINHPSGEKKIYFDLALIVGDNLGLHSIFGLVESFSANKFCRFCLINHEEINQKLKESDCILRNISNYNSLLRIRDPKQSGIKEECVFNKILGFHVTKNPAVDVMHDIGEGILRYDIALMLNYYINVRKFFTLDYVNTKIRAFHYGSKNNVNKPPEILESHLKKKCIILSAAEMLNLAKNLTLIIGNSVDETDEHWQIFSIMKDILDIVCSTKVHLRTCQVLKLKIEEYLNLLTEKFPNCLKPKHHFLIHYPSIMRQVGPLWPISCMRFESKNREGKQISHAAICRVNICKTIALRHQLVMNYRFLCKNSYYPTYIANHVRSVYIRDIPGISSFMNLWPKHLNDKVDLTNCIQYKGQSIKKDTVIVTFSELEPQFNFVHLIILIDANNFFIMTKSMLDCYFNHHRRAYKIHSNEFHWELLTKADINTASVSYYNKLNDGNFYITKNWM